MYEAQKTTGDNNLPARFIRSVLTAVTAGSGYGVAYGTPQQRLSAMLTYVVNEGRLFALKPSEWSMLLGGVTLCGLLTLLF